jgi:hypothetical protein
MKQYEIDGVIVDSGIELDAPTGTGTARIHLTPTNVKPSKVYDPARFGPRFADRPSIATVLDGFVLNVADLLEAHVTNTGSVISVWSDRDLDPASTARLVMSQVIPYAFSRHRATIVFRGESIESPSGTHALVIGETSAWVRVVKESGKWMARSRPIDVVLSMADSFGQTVPLMTRLAPGPGVTELVMQSLLLEDRGTRSLTTLLARFGMLIDDLPVYRVRARPEDRASAIDQALAALAESGHHR